MDPGGIKGEKFGIFGAESRNSEWIRLEIPGEKKIGKNSNIWGTAGGNSVFRNFPPNPKSFNKLGIKRGIPGFPPFLLFIPNFGRAQEGKGKEREAQVEKIIKK